MSYSFGGILFRKRVFIIEQNSKNLNSEPNEVKQIVHAIDIHD